MLRVRFRDECGRAATFARLDEAGSRARWQILWQLVSIRLSYTVALPSRDKGALPRIQEYDRINLISRFVRFRHNAMSHRRRRLPSSSRRRAVGRMGTAAAEEAASLLRSAHAETQAPVRLSGGPTD